jgi:soluble lytic murein transglycosylase
VAYPRPFKRVVDAEVKRSGIPEHLAYAIMREESAFKPRVVSSADAVGLMQLILPTAQSMARPLGLTASVDTLKTPETNIALGCRFLSVLQRRFDYNPLLAVPGYNAGPGAPTRWLKERPEQDFDLWVEAIPYRETRRYTKRVLGSMAAYGMIYGGGMGEPMMVLPLKAMPDGTSLD